MDGCSIMACQLPDPADPASPGSATEVALVALQSTVQRLPEHLWAPLTWDQGEEIGGLRPRPVKGPGTSHSTDSPSYQLLSSSARRY